MKIPENKIKPSVFIKFKKLLKKAGLSITEWHSIMIGAGTGLIAGPPEAIAVYGMVTGAKETVKRSKKLDKVQDLLGNHFKDVKQEFGYFVGSFIIAEYGLQLLQGII